MKIQFLSFTEFLNSPVTLKTLEFQFLSFTPPFKGVKLRHSRGDIKNQKTKNVTSNQ